MWYRTCALTLNPQVMWQIYQSIQKKTELLSSRSHAIIYGLYNFGLLKKYLVALQWSIRQENISSAWDQLQELSLNTLKDKLCQQLWSPRTRVEQYEENSIVMPPILFVVWHTKNLSAVERFTQCFLQHWSSTNIRWKWRYEYNIHIWKSDTIYHRTFRIGKTLFPAPQPT